MLAIIVVLLILMGIFMAVGASTPQTDAAGLPLNPLQRFTAGFSRSVNGFLGAFSRVKVLEEENEQLRQQLLALQQDIIELDMLRQENANFRDYLEIKGDHPDFELEDAVVISRDPSSPFYTFTINKGSLHGIKLHDPVINAGGLVGYISQVSPAVSTVTTLMDPILKVGAMDARTRGDTGMVHGDIKLVSQGLCRMDYLDQNSAVAIGDLIVTTGIGGIFPKDLLIGSVTDVGQSTTDISMYAIVSPSADIRQLRDVVVITYFEGQGGITSPDVTSDPASQP